MYHLPVLLKESVDALAIKAGGVYVDATFGGGGHSKEILKRIDNKSSLIVFDQDVDALKNIVEDDRLIFINHNYRHLKRFLKVNGFDTVNGILADFGISSHQIDQPERGFSIRYDAALDMRMNQHQEISAADIVNRYSQEQLQNIFSQYGEIRNSRTLAAAIVKERAFSKIDTTSQLKQIAKLFTGANEMQYLAQVFQAIRMEVNQEVDSIKEFLTQSLEVLAPEGRLVTLSYHSIEDRLVKNFMRFGHFEEEATKDQFGNIYRPFELINKKPITANADEVRKNPRARSVKMRIAAKK